MRDRNRGVRILAKSVFKALNEQGYDTGQMVAFATEIIGHVASQLERNRDAPEPPREAKVRSIWRHKRRGVRSAPPVTELDKLELVG